MRSIDDAIEQLLDDIGNFASGDLVRLTGRTRQAVSRHLRRWVASGRILREGAGRATRYRRVSEVLFERDYDTTGLQEDRVWLDARAAIPALHEASAKNADDITAYAITEVINNAIDHSGSPSVRVCGSIADKRVVFVVTDHGIGAFESIRTRFDLDHSLAALQELTKGKVTTMPERHTGEGLFFTSKAVDHFELAANGLVWIVDNDRADFAIRESPVAIGTVVRLRLRLDTERTLVGVFEPYTRGYDFDTTRAVIKLFEHGVRFVSRSEAKRLMSGMERFRKVILDFAQVQAVGQGFVDEVFRVWANAHPAVELEPVHMVREVEFMVRRGS